jgi:hypothetical protein
VTSGTLVATSGAFPLAMISYGLRADADVADPHPRIGSRIAASPAAVS